MTTYSLYVSYQPLFHVIWSYWFVKHERIVERGAEQGEKALLVQRGGLGVRFHLLFSRKRAGGSRCHRIGRHIAVDRRCGIIPPVVRCCEGIVAIHSCPVWCTVLRQA